MNPEERSRLEQVVSQAYDAAIAVHRPRFAVPFAFLQPGIRAVLLQVAEAVVKAGRQKAVDQTEKP